MQRFTVNHMKAGVIVSSLELYMVELPSRHLAVIEEVNTTESHRKKGYATQNIQKAIELAREKGATCVELTVREDRPDLQEFYKSLGFTDRLQRAMRLTLGAT